ARPPPLPPGPQPWLPGPVSAPASCRGLSGSAPRCTTDPLWKCRVKYTVRPVGMKKTGGRDHTGECGVRARPRAGAVAPAVAPCSPPAGCPCRSADIALVAGGNRKRWIIATENMQPGDSITNSPHIGRIAVSASEGDAYPLGALPVGTLICNLESHPGKGAQYIRAAGTCGVLLRKVNGTAIVQLPSKRHIQVLETCVATVGRVSNVNHNKRVIGKAGRNRWLGKRPHTGLWHRKGGWAGRKIRPLPPMKSYVNLPRVKAVE
ncbi:RM02 protein, partial [Drymodes brunneopygia]|nr:RM02 protein [Drymodes brunneopygia]